jgi:hypothetical protein
VTKSEFARTPEFYGYCPVKLGERVMVHPNGTIRICSNLICTGYGVARYHDGRIEWDNSSGNELAGHDLSRSTPCTNRSRHRKYGELVPLCFSFKPDQAKRAIQPYSPSNALTTVRPSGVSTSRPAASRSTKPRTTIAVSVAPVTPGLGPFGARGDAKQQYAFRNTAQQRLKRPSLDDASTGHGC